MFFETKLKQKEFYHLKLIEYYKNDTFNKKFITSRVCYHYDKINRTKEFLEYLYSKDVLLYISWYERSTYLYVSFEFPSSSLNYGSLIKLLRNWDVDTWWLPTIARLLKFVKFVQPKWLELGKTKTFASFARVFCSMAQIACELDFVLVTKWTLFQTECSNAVSKFNSISLSYGLRKNYCLLTIF